MLSEITCSIHVAEQYLYSFDGAVFTTPRFSFSIFHLCFNLAPVFSARHPARKDRNRASLRACSPFYNRRGRETKTSSDASDEAPERARKDTSEEAKLHLCGSAILCAFPVEFLRLPSDASHVRGGGLGETALPRGNSVLPRRFESLRLALAATLYQKSGLLTEISRRDFSAAGLSGLSLPDAPCEHTTIRASTTNLTNN